MPILRWCGFSGKSAEIPNQKHHTSEGIITMSEPLVDFHTRHLLQCQHQSLGA